MNFCSYCGHAVGLQTPLNDDRPRFVCSSCGTIHYQNPRVLVGYIPVVAGKVLLCRRAIEPRKGFWTLPAGFLENGETSQEGAQRELFEEARARVQCRGVYRLMDIPHINQLYIFYLGNVIDGDFQVGQESTDVGLFAEQEVPWEELSFYGIGQILREYFSDFKSGNFKVRISNHRVAENANGLSDSFTATGTVEGYKLASD